jgi:hypothetical protein
VVWLCVRGGAFRSKRMARLVIVALTLWAPIFFFSAVTLSGAERGMRQRGRRRSGRERCVDVRRVYR